MHIKNAIIAAALILFPIQLQAESKFLVIAYCKTPIAYVGGDEKKTSFALASYVFNHPNSVVAKHLLKVLKASKDNFHAVQLDKVIGLSCPINV